MADLLVIAGDLTNYGKPAEMEQLLNSLVRLRLPSWPSWEITTTKADRKRNSRA